MKRFAALFTVIDQTTNTIGQGGGAGGLLRHRPG